MANESATKPSYSELLTELLRVRGLLQRLFGLVESGALVRNVGHDGDMMAFMKQSTLLVSTLAQVQNELTPPNFPQSSSLVSQGAESAHSGKQNTADKSGASPELLPTQLPISKHSLTPEPQSTQLDTHSEKK